MIVSFIALFWCSLQAAHLVSVTFSLRSLYHRSKGYLLSCSHCSFAVLFFLCSLLLLISIRLQFKIHSLQKRLNGWKHLNIVLWIPMPSKLKCRLGFMRLIHFSDSNSSTELGVFVRFPIEYEMVAVVYLYAKINAVLNLFQSGQNHSPDFEPGACEFICRRSSNSWSSCLSCFCADSLHLFSVVRIVCVFL